MKHTSGAKMRALRLMSRFTQEQVASLITMHINDYTEFEQGIKEPTAQLKEDLSNLYSKPKNYWDEETTASLKKPSGTVTQLKPPTT